MTHWTLTFTVLALFAAVLGFSSLAGGVAAGVAQILFVAFAILVGVSAFSRILEGRIHHH